MDAASASASAGGLGGRAPAIRLCPVMRTGIKQRTQQSGMPRFFVDPTMHDAIGAGAIIRDRLDFACGEATLRPAIRLAGRPDGSGQRLLGTFRFTQWFNQNGRTTLT
jgi:hypothetical protein